MDRDLNYMLCKLQSCASLRSKIVQIHNDSTDLVCLLGSGETRKENSLSDRGSSCQGHCENSGLAVSHTHGVESRLGNLEWWEAGDVLLLEENHSMLTAGQKKTLALEPRHQIVPHVTKRGIIHHRDTGRNAPFTSIGLDHRDPDIVEIVTHLRLSQDLLVLNPALLYDIAYQFGRYHAFVIVGEHDSVGTADQVLQGLQKLPRDVRLHVGAVLFVDSKVLSMVQNKPGL